MGTGNIGRTIGGAWERAGHQVAYASRSPEPPQVGIAEAIAAAEVVLLAVPGAAVEPLLAEHGAALAGKLVFDATNRVGADRLHDAGAFACHAPDARVARAFNSVGWEAMADPRGTDMFWCGPPEAEQLVADVGLRPIRVGDIDAVDVVDGVARLWLTLVLRGGRPRSIRIAMVDPAA